MTRLVSQSAHSSLKHCKKRRWQCHILQPWTITCRASSVDHTRNANTRRACHFCILFFIPMVLWISLYRDVEIHHMSFKPHKQQFPECKTRLRIGLGTRCTVLETYSRIIYDQKPKLPIQRAHAVRADQAPAVWHGYWQLSMKFYWKAQRQVSLLAGMLTQQGFALSCGLV